MSNLLSEFRISKFTTFSGRDYEGFSGVLKWDGLEIGDFEDEGNGGSMRITIYPSVKDRFMNVVKEYLVECGLLSRDNELEEVAEYSLLTTFIIHVLDFTETGKVQNETLHFGLFI